MKYTIEIAVNDFRSASAAVEGGADRLELCAALSEGGITPSYSILRQCRERFSIPLFPIIRPRGGDFLFSDDEFRIMRKDVQLCRELGCDGVVVGALTREGYPDLRISGMLRELAYPMEVTFHRAFDRCRDPFTALEQLVELGFQRILTSGQQLTALEGLDLLHDLVEAADGRIGILPGSGIRPYNVHIITERTGVTEVHASLSQRIRSNMAYVHPVFAEEGDHTLAGIEPDDVRALRAALER